MSENTAGADQGAQDQPTPDKGTDFNDLLNAAKSSGLTTDQIRELLLPKVNLAIDPVPRIKELTKDAAEEADLKEALRRYRQITKPGQLTTDVWDTNEKTKLKKTLFTSKVGPRISKLWFESSPAQIDSYTVASSIAEQTGKGSDELKSMTERFVVIEGTKDVWDKHKWRRQPLDTLKAAYPNDYPIWMASPNRQMVDSDNVVFDPSGRRFHKSNDPHINTFQGLPLSLGLTDEEIEQHSLPVRRLLQHLCSGDYKRGAGGARVPDNTMHDWVERWLAIPLQRLGTKMDTALIFHGMTQGAGKSLFFDKIMRRIYGKYTVVLSQGDLETQYNDWIDSKLFAVFEEIMQGTQRFTGMGFVKQLITGQKIRISKKFMSGYELDNFVNTVFLSNDLIPLKLEENDRRHAVCYPTSKIPPDLLAEVSDGLSDPDDLMCRAYFAWLLKLPLVDASGVKQTAHTEPPLNKAKRNIIMLSRMSHEAFVAAWRMYDIPFAPYQCASSQDLLEAYTIWCKKQNIRGSCALNKLIMHIKHTSPPGESVARMKVAGYNKGPDRPVGMVQVGSPPENSPLTLTQWRRDLIGDFSVSIRGQKDQDEEQFKGRRYAKA